MNPSSKMNFSLINKIKNNSKSSNFFVLLYFLGLSYLMMFLVGYNFDFDPLDPIGQTSALAFGQLVFWTAAGLSLILLLFTSKKSNWSSKKLSRIFLITISSLITGTISGTAVLSLNGTPWYFGAPKGDLGVLMFLSNIAIDIGWSGSLYPPAWPTIVGNLSEFLGVAVFDSYKPISLIAGPIFAGITLILFRLAFPPVLAELSAVFSAFTFGDSNWKSAGTYWILLTLLILIKRIWEIENEERIYDRKSRLGNLGLGFFFGLSISFYYAILWWLLPGIAISIFILKWIFKFKTKSLSSILDFFIGLSIFPFVHIFATIKYGIVFTHILIFTLVIAISRIALFRINFVEKILVNIFTIIFPVVLIVASLRLDVNDTYLDGARIGNPIINLGYSNLEMIVSFSVILLYLYLVQKGTAVLPLQYSFLIIGIVSSTFMMLIYASQMYRTNLVELWPRAQSTIFLLFNQILLIAIFYVLKYVFDLFNSSMHQIHLKKSMVLVGLIFTFFMSINLSQVQFGLFARDGNQTMFSYEALNE